MVWTELFTVVGVFRDPEQARDAIQKLMRAGFAVADIGVLAQDEDQTRALAQDTGATASAGTPVALGIPPTDSVWYEQEIREGGTLVAVRAHERVNEAWDVLRRCGGYNSGSQNAPGTPGRDVEGKRVVELREEELVPAKGVEESSEVEVRKEVVTETRRIEVPVARERLVVHTTGEADVRVEGQSGGRRGAAAALWEAWEGARQRVPLGAASGSLALVGTAAGGVWLYRRRQRERNRPLNRFQRRLRSLTSQMNGRVLDNRELARYVGRADISPATGAGALLLVLSLLAGSRWRGRAARETAADQAPALLHDATQTWLTPAFDQLRQRWVLMQPLAAQATSAETLSRLQTLGAHRARPRLRAVASMLALVAAGYLIWRWLRGRKTGERGRSFIGTSGVETAGGRDRTQTAELSPNMGMEQPG